MGMQKAKCESCEIDKAAGTVETTFVSETHGPMVVHSTIGAEEDAPPFEKGKTYPVDYGATVPLAERPKPAK